MGWARKSISSHFITLPQKSNRTHHPLEGSAAQPSGTLTCEAGQEHLHPLPILAGLEARNKGAEASPQLNRERRHPGPSWMGRSGLSAEPPPPQCGEKAPGKSIAPSEPQCRFLLSTCRLEAKSYPTPQCLHLCHPRLWTPGRDCAQVRTASSPCASTPTLSLFPI